MIGAPASAGFLGSGSYEQLPTLGKTSSYPASPNSPTSPTVTEFAATPIDVSFGDRVEPPDRPPPSAPLTAPLPNYGDRAGLPSQRSRSGTITKEPATAGLTVEKMSLYQRHAGDGGYDDDAEADDEYESTMLSPTLPTHYDDGESDHPSESEEDTEDESVVDGEDTPTTQGWADRDGRSPTGMITQWSIEQVADFVTALSPALKQYGRSFVDEGVDGDALKALKHDELREMGIASVGHRLTILKAVYEAKKRSGIKFSEDDYVPLSAEGEKSENEVTQDDIARVIESIRLRDQRIIAAEAELRALKYDLDRVVEENRKLREEALPIMRHFKDQRTPLPDPAGGTIPSPRELDTRQENIAPVKEAKTTGLSRKFSTKKLFLGAPKQPSPTHPPPPSSHTPQPKEIRDDGNANLEASAAAMAASSHLTASFTSQTSPNSVHGQLSPTSPAYSTQGPSSGGSYGHQPGSASANRTFPRNDVHSYNHRENYDSNASTLIGDYQNQQERSRRQAPTPSPREDEPGSGGRREREKDRDRDRGDRDNPAVEIFKSFRVSIDDPCRVVLPVALKRYNISDDWRQYALYIVHGDQERCLGLEEKPLLLFKQLDKEGRKPMFMLRRHASPQEGFSSLTAEAGAKHIPGGVL